VKDWLIAFLVVVVVILIIGICLIVFVVKPIANNSATGSFLASAYQSIWDYCKENPEKVDSSSVSVNWKIVSEEDYQYLMDHVFDPYMLDKGRMERSKETVLLDIWKNRIGIAYRKSDESLEFILWSKGRDGIEGTEDDITSPYEAEVPYDAERGSLFVLE
jgi:hypothetical protein